MHRSFVGYVNAIMASCVMATATSFNRFLVSRSSQMAARPKANAHHVNQMNGSTVPANAELLANKCQNFG
jgi:hypothetical protein